jgi:hypothetical protein
MSGGKVIHTVVMRDRVWVGTDDGHEKCATYVERNAKSRTISEGDSLWWQGGRAYWTPKEHGGNTKLHDIVIPRIGEKR